MPARPTASFAAAALSAIFVAAVAVGAGACTLQRMPAGVIMPNIVPSAGERGAQTVARDFAFETARMQLSVPVDLAVYAGSVGAQKSAIFIGAADPGDWVPGYYRAFIDEPHQTAFYDSMAKALHAVRQRENLDAARYVELVTSMVQQIEYRIDPVNLDPKFPIETFADGYGDCDDKTLLAAALLSRDGYDVSILLFTPEKHVALGIRAPGLDYKNTGYAYVEMTEPSLVGVPTENLAGGVRLTSQPVVIRVGEGRDAYTAGSQIDYIRQRLSTLRDTLARFAQEISALKADLASRQASLQTARQAVQAKGDPASRAAAAQRYNSLVNQYNTAVGRVNAAIDRSNRLVDLERFVTDGQTARPQVYERLRAATL